MSPIERNIAQKELKHSPYQSIFFTDTQHAEPRPIFSDVAPERIPTGCKVVAFAGIAHPERFFESLESKYNVVEKLSFSDHHIYKVREVRKIMDVVARYGEDVVVITTEKDGVKLTSRKYIPQELQQRLFVQPIELNFRDGNSGAFIERLKKELQNKKL